MSNHAIGNHILIHPQIGTMESKIVNQLCEPIIKLKEVSKYYNKRDTQTKVLDKINFEIHRSEFVAILGVSGSGKSTLLNIIGCIDKPCTGEVHICHQNIEKLSDKKLTYIRRKHIGFIFQLFNLLPTLSVFDNIRYSPYTRRFPCTKEKILEVAQLVGLHDLLHRRPNELSGGQAQRVAIARAIITHPDIILADEPTANLDSENAKRIMDLLYSLQQKLKLTIVLATHDHSNISASIKKLFIKDGQIIL